MESHCFLQRHLWKSKFYISTQLSTFLRLFRVQCLIIQCTTDIIPITASTKPWKVGLYSILCFCHDFYSIQEGESMILEQMETSFKMSRLVFSSFIIRASTDRETNRGGNVKTPCRCGQGWFDSPASRLCPSMTHQEAACVCSSSMTVKLSTPRYFSCEPASYTAELS